MLRVTSPLPSSTIVVPSKFIVVTSLTDTGISLLSITVNPSPEDIATPTLPAAPAVTVAPPENVIVSTEETVVEPSSTAKVDASIVTVTSPFKSSVIVAPLKEMLSTPLTLPTCNVYEDGSEPLKTPCEFNSANTLASV